MGAGRNTAHAENVAVATNNVAGSAGISASLPTVGAPNFADITARNGAAVTGPTAAVTTPSANASSSSPSRPSASLAANSASTAGALVKVTQSSR